MILTKLQLKILSHQVSPLADHKQTEFMVVSRKTVFESLANISYGDVSYAQINEAFESLELNNFITRLPEDPDKFLVSTISCTIISIPKIH